MSQYPCFDTVEASEHDHDVDEDDHESERHHHGVPDDGDGRDVVVAAGHVDVDGGGGGRLLEAVVGGVEDVLLHLLLQLQRGCVHLWEVWREMRGCGFSRQLLVLFGAIQTSQEEK